MNDNSDNEFNRSFFAVLGGVFASIAAGFLIKLIVEKIFHIDAFSSSSLNAVSNNFQLEVILGAWLFISSLIGGLICAVIAGKNDVSHIIISSLVVLAFYFVISGGGILKEQSLASWAILVVIPIGYSIGEWVGSYRGKKKV